MPTINRLIVKSMATLLAHARRENVRGTFEPEPLGNKSDEPPQERS